MGSDWYFDTFFYLKKGPGRKTVLFLTGTFVALSSYAIDFSIQQISKEQMVNRDPVISETGLAAWMYYSTNEPFSANSHIAVFHENQMQELTAELTTILYGAVKPSVHSNQLIFVGSARGFTGNTTWTLQEVIDRDNGEIRELSALYNVTEKNGEQIFTPVPTAGTSTNESVVPIVGLDTNGARRLPSGEAEIWSWRVGDTDVQRVTHDLRDDFSPGFWGNTIAWQKAKGWPFGWEIMALVGDTRIQLTTNYYYDMGAKAHGDKVVWYGWDGFDYEIFMYDSVKNETIQITSNRYDDVAPVIWGDVIVWEGYAAVESDIFMWKDGVITKISNNIDDDLHPRIWNNKVVWQGFDGDDFEIYLYDIGKGEVTQITGNRFDDTNPDIHDDLIVWTGYHDNWDAEVFYADLRAGPTITPVQLTSNEEDDRDPKTASRRIIWVSERENMTHIMLAEPK